MIKIALVGSIGSGKSFISKLFGYPVFNADKEVNYIYSKNITCFNKLRKTFPNYISTFPINKEELISCILANQKNIKKISNIVHPLVKKRLKIFINNNKKKKFLILDIPLYLENKLNTKKDIIIFIDSKKKDIEKRLFKRKAFNKQIHKLLKKIQLPLKIKKQKSNFVIKNDFSVKTVKKSVKYFLRNLVYERNST